MKKLFIIFLLLLFVLISSSCGIIEELMLYQLDEPAANAVDGRLMIEVIDVGQGDSILIITPEGKIMLIDCGESDAYKSVSSVLNDRGVSRIDWLIATHPHSDHIGCMYKIVKKYDIGQVYMPDKIHTSRTYEKLLESIEDKNLTIKSARAGAEIDMGGGVMCRMFSPISGKEYANLNDLSPIMRISYGRTSFLTTGDAETENEKDAMEYSEDLTSTVLKLGHHGSSTSTSEEFLLAVQPSYGIISVGKDNSYGHPDKETLKLFAKYGIPLVQTKDEGNICIVSDGKTITINGIAVENTSSDIFSVELVYKTNTGKTYHKKGCSYLGDSFESLTLEQAKAMGLKACSRCNP